MNWMFFFIFFVHCPLLVLHHFFNFQIIKEKSRTQVFRLDNNEFLALGKHLISFRIQLSFFKFTLQTTGQRRPSNLMLNPVSGSEKFPLLYIIGLKFLVTVKFRSALGSDDQYNRTVTFNQKKL